MQAFGGNFAATMAPPGNPDIFDFAEVRSPPIGKPTASVRDNFAEMINCKTLALGEEIYASESEEKRV